jgi:hypothetical protein
LQHGLQSRGQSALTGSGERGNVLNFFAAKLVLNGVNEGA